MPVPTPTNSLPALSGCRAANRIRGTKYYISGADESAALLVVARTDETTGSREALSLFIVPTGAKGLEMTPIPVEIVSSEKQFTLFFDDVIVGEERGGPHRLDHLAAFLRWTPQFLLPPVREILRGGEPEGKVPLRMFFQASVHLLRRRPSVRRVRSLAVV